MQPLILALLILTGAAPCFDQQPLWQQFVSQEGRFAASMPNEPKTSIVVTRTAESSLVTHISSSTDNELNEFLISWTEYPQDNIEERGTEKTFNRARDALVATREGKVLKEAVMKINGYHGRVTTFETSAGKTVTVVFCFARNRFYQVMAETNRDNAASERFVNSFRVLPGMPL